MIHSLSADASGRSGLRGSVVCVFQGPGFEKVLYLPWLQFPFSIFHPAPSGRIYWYSSCTAVVRSLIRICNICKLQYFWLAMSLKITCFQKCSLVTNASISVHLLFRFREITGDVCSPISRNTCYVVFRLNAWAVPPSAMAAPGSVHSVDRTIGRKLDALRNFIFMKHPAFEVKTGTHSFQAPAAGRFKQRRRGASVLRRRFRSQRPTSSRPPEEEDRRLVRWPCLEQSQRVSDATENGLQRRRIRSDLS